MRQKITAMERELEDVNKQLCEGQEAMRQKDEAPKEVQELEY